MKLELDNAKVAAKTIVKDDSGFAFTAWSQSPLLLGAASAGTGGQPQHGRFTDTDAGTVYQGKLRIPKGYKPPHNCRHSLLGGAEQLELKEVEDIVEDLDIRMRQLVAEGVCAKGSPEYERRYSLFGYTYEAAFLEKRQQLYMILNADLRARSSQRSI
jgi:hypothetical protein